jgi:hypothetical protein
MSIVYSRLLTFEQAREVEALNQANMLEHLSAETAQTKGFLTALYPADLLMQMAVNTPTAIALQQNRVVGFLVLNSPLAHLPVHRSAMSALGQRLYKGRPLASYRYVRCGPLCVSSEVRKRSVAKGLYNFVAREYQQFDLFVVRVNQTNGLSLEAHKKLGFRQFDIEHGSVTWIHMAKELTSARL